jgi:hypothetical protein
MKLSKGTTMTLSLEEGVLFYQLMWKLQYYVNQKLGIDKNFSSPEEYASLPTKKKLKIRNALWEHPELIKIYADENPNQLGKEDLEIIIKWQNFVKGSFYILRHLKKGSIFIGDKNAVYAVHGIQDPLEEIIPSYALPRMVEAILLPFKGQIIYDGLLSGYNISFGGGIRADLNYTYTVAKAKARIITTFEPDIALPKPTKPTKNSLPQLKELAVSAAALKGETPLQKATLALVNAGLNLAIANTQGISNSSGELETQERKIRKATSRLLNLLDIMKEE